MISDFGGSEIPVDAQYMGEQAYAAMVLNRFDNTVLTSFRARLQGATPGTSASNTVGSLMVAQGLAFTVFLYAPYSSLSWQNNQTTKGYTFPCAWLHDDFLDPISIEVENPELVIRAIPYWNASNLSSVLFSNTLPDPIPTAD